MNLRPITSEESDCFFSFFMEHQKANGELNLFTKTNFLYNKKVRGLKIHQLIQKQLGKIKGFKAEHGAYSIELSGKLSTAKLEVFQDLITIRCPRQL